MFAGLVGWLGCALVFACPSHAAWSAPQRVAVSGVSRLGDPQVARDAAGDAVAVWGRGSRYPSHNRTDVIEAATRGAGGSWSKPVVLALGHSSLGPIDAKVAMSSRGEATVVWEQFASDGETPECRRGQRQRRCTGEQMIVRTAVEARSHPANGGWGRTSVLASGRFRSGHKFASDEFEPDAQVAVNRDGDVTVAYRMRVRNGQRAGGREQVLTVGGKQDVLLSTRRPGGRWRRPVVVAHTANSDETQLALDARGGTILAWNNGGSTGGGEHEPSWVEALVLARDDKPQGRPQVLSSKSRHAGEFDLAANSQGVAVLTWSQELAEGEGRGPVEAATRPAGGRFTTKPVTLLRKSSMAIAAISPQGEATALFEGSFPTGSEEEASGALEAATLPARGSWSKPQALAPKSGPYALAYGPDSELIALWGNQLPPLGPPEHKVAKAVIEASIKPAGGTWQPPTAVTPENSNSTSANLALATNGQATAIWLREPTPGEELIETADYKPS